MITRLRAEWLKFATVRSGWTLLVIAAVATMAALVLGLLVEDASDLRTVEDQAGTILGGTAVIAALLLVIYGVTRATSELKSSAVVPFLIASPQRADAVAAKAVVTALVSFVYGLALLAAVTVVGVVWLNVEGIPVEVANAQFVEAFAGTLAYLVVGTLFGLGLGYLTMSATLGVTAALLIPLAVETTIKATIHSSLERFLPFSAGQSLLDAANGGGDATLPPWEGGGVFLLWAALLVVLGWLRFERKDLGAT